MTKKIVTLRKTFTRAELIGSTSAGKAHEYSPINSGNWLTARLLDVGIPVIGAFGILAVEHGELTVTHEDGLDGDEWTYSWTGEKLPPGWPKRERAHNTVIKLALDKPLAAQIAAEDEL